MVKDVVLGLSLVCAGILAGVTLHTAVTRGDTVFAGKRPDNLGVHDGRLAAPRRSPNCVSSQADPADSQHFIAPIAFSGSRHEAFAALRGVVEAAPRARILRHEEGYLYAEFTSKRMGFVDDVEFFVPAGGNLIHVRSASRLGRRDFGVNRDRIEAIRERFAAAQRKTLKT